MSSYLSNLANNISKEIHRINVNSDVTIKNMKHVELNMIIASVFSNIQTLKMI